MAPFFPPMSETLAVLAAAHNLTAEQVATVAIRLGAKVANRVAAGLKPVRRFRQGPSPAWTPAYQAALQQVAARYGLEPHVLGARLRVYPRMLARNRVNGRKGGRPPEALSEDDFIVLLAEEHFANHATGEGPFTRRAIDARAKRKIAEAFGPETPERGKRRHVALRAFKIRRASHKRKRRAATEGLGPPPDPDDRDA